MVVNQGISRAEGSPAARLCAMRFQHTDRSSHLVRAWGSVSALEISAPLSGVIRVRFAPSAHASSFLFPNLETKSSWAVVSSDALLLEALEDDDVLSVEAHGAHLEVQLNSGAWSFWGEDSRVLCQGTGLDGSVRNTYPVTEYTSSLSLHAPTGEAYLGFGEKVGALNKRGMHFRFWNTDVVPHHPDTDPLYQSIPFFIGLRDGVAWGCFVDESWRMDVDVARDDPNCIRWTSSGPEMDVYLIAGPSVATVLERFTALTGRTPLAPLWALGAQQSRWGYENEREIRAVLAGYKQHELPLDAIYTDIDYMDGYKVWRWDSTRYPNPTKLVQDAAIQGVRVIPIIDPGVKLEPGYSVYDEALEHDYLVRLDRGDVLVGEVWPRPAVFPDFTRAAVRQWWGTQHKAFTDIGIAGFWNDMNEPSCFSLQRTGGGFTADGNISDGVGRIEGKTLPDDARHGEKRHLEVHNVYGLTMCQATREGLEQLRPDKRPFVLTRAGFAGIQRFSAVWTGDNSSYWAHLESSIAMLMGLGLSGVAFTGSDIPGFTGAPSAELMVRWYQLGVFYPLMRNHSAKGTPYQEPWRFGAETLRLVREALERRYRLLPTLYTLLHEATKSGLPVMRPLVMHDPRDLECINANDQFLFGDALLVAPVVRPGDSKQLAYLPTGRWLEFNNFTPGQFLEGGRYVIADAPSDAIPMFLRAGGAIALTRAARHTTTANWDTLEWHVGAGEEITGALYEDAGEGYSDSRETRITGSLENSALTLERTVTGAFPLEREMDVLYVYGLKEVSSVGGAKSHEFRDGVLRLEVSADWTRLEVR
jgi:alpha-glucosidase